jgi:hypothetical protein
MFLNQQFAPDEDKLFTTVTDNDRSSQHVNSSSGPHSGGVPLLLLPSVFPILQTVTKRGVWPQGVRSKIILRPERVVTSLVHQMDETLPGYAQVVVGDDVAACFHFRHGPLLVQDPGVEDREMLKYAATLTHSPLAQALLDAVQQQR